MAYDEAYNEPEQVEVLIKVVAGADTGNETRAGGTQEHACREGEPGGDSSAPYLRYAHYGDAGVDLATTREFELRPFERALVPTGVAIALPAGYVGFVNPRSGLAARQGVTVLNAPGTIDSGYRGEIKVPLINLDPERTAVFQPGDRIAQLIIQRYVEARFVPAQKLPGSQRSDKGFGSTGLRSQ